MGWIVGGRFCECVVCGKEFMGDCGKALYWHMRHDHEMDHDEAFESASQSMDNNVSSQDFHIPGIG